MRGIRGLGDPPVGDDGREEVPGVLDGALLGGVVEADDAEARDLALGPLPVVDEAPVVVALDRQAGAGDGAQVVVEVARAE